MRHLTKTRARIIALCFAGLFMPAGWTADNGAALYSRHCASCHGHSGEGGVGVPLALPSFLESVSDEYLRKTIELGRPGRVMPGFPKLEPAAIDAIIRHMRGWLASGAKRYIAGDAERGKKLYAQHCAECHGANGEGGKGTGVTFSRPRDHKIVAPALNNSGFLASASDHMIKSALMTGREGTPMVSYLAQGLTEQDIDNVVAYIRSFEASTKKTTTQGESKQEPLLLVYESSRNFKETIESVKQAVVAANFRFIREQPLLDKLAEKNGQTHQHILYFCNFNMLNQALQVDPRVGLFLPCRVTVLQEGDKIKVMAVNPKALSPLFNNDELDELCQKMHDLYASILEEATL